MDKKTQKILFYAPRILTITFILFISLFALDIFGQGYTFWETIVGLFMHLIPSFVLTICLIIAWKYELFGAIAYFLFGLWYIITVASSQGILIAFMWSLQIAGPAFLIGILFFVNWKISRKTQ